MSGGKRRDLPVKKRSLVCLSPYDLIMRNITRHVTRVNLYWFLKDSDVLHARLGRKVRAVGWCSDFDGFEWRNCRTLGRPPAAAVGGRRRERVLDAEYQVW